MLELFRKYQRFLYIIVTIVIVISFSFFGTYSSITPEDPREQVAFHSLDGTPVKRSEVEEMVFFLSSDSEDKTQYGGAWGPNFLNDGVIKHDFLQTGLAQVLIDQYAGMLENDLQVRLEKEKRFSFYQHPQAKFVSAQAAWAMFSPDIRENIDALRLSQKSVDPKAINARIQLYLSEKSFPASTLRQVLKYQERQYSWLSPDPSLDQTDLAMFGYHTVEDWFGPRFIRIIAQFIINSSKIAEKRGYDVSKTEALTDLLRSASISYQQQGNNPNLGVKNASEYFNEQLRRLNLDQTKAIKIWRQVLLFRRLFHDMGASVFADRLVNQAFSRYTGEAIEADMYHLPRDLQISNFDMLQKFEIYLNAISKRDSDEALSLPKTFLSVGEIERKYPELVQKRYYLEIADSDKKSLQGRISLKETWNWEVEDTNWSALKEKFTELALKKAETRQERFAMLDMLDDQTRAKVDAFARSGIIDAHPEWMEEGLKKASYKKVVVGLREKGGKFPFSGVENRSELIGMLDKAPIGEPLPLYSGDKNTYYKITVLDRSPAKEIMTFAEAHKEGLLESLLNRQLETNYIQVRQTKPELFQNADKSWSEFTAVKNLVGEQYFSKVLEALRQLSIAKELANQGKTLTPDVLATLRFYSYMQGLDELAQKNSSKLEDFLAAENDKLKDGKLAQRENLNDQWKLEKNTLTIDRSASGLANEKEEAFLLPVNAWSKVNIGNLGDLNFLQVKQKGLEQPSDKLAMKVDKTKSGLSESGQKALMLDLIGELQKKNAINLDYLKAKDIPAETTES